MVVEKLPMPALLNSVSSCPHAAIAVTNALSTAAGLLLAISSAISHDLLKRTLMPDISERQELMASRLAMAAAVLGAAVLAKPQSFPARYARGGALRASALRAEGTPM